MFFDCNCRIGRPCVGFKQEFTDVATLTEEMRYFGIDRALVYHFLAVEYDPATGNEQLSREIEDREHLEACWVLIPDHTGEMESPHRIVEQMRARNIKAARMFPRKHKFCVAPWNAGKILSTLSRHRIPLFIDLDQIDWQEVHDLCKKWADLPVVLTNVNSYIDRMVYPLLKEFKNLYVEISHYSAFRGLESICQKFGAEQLLFGTRMPEFESGSSKTMVAFARISQQQKDLISHKNLEALLNGIR